MTIFNEKDFKNKILEFKSNSNNRDAIELCCDTIQYGEKNNDHRAQIEGYFHRGVLYYNIGDVKNAFNDLMHHRELIEKECRNEDLLNSYNFLFVLHLYNEEYKKSKEALKQLINLSNRLDYKVMMSNAYSNYAHVLNLETSHAEALIYAQKSYTIAMRYEPNNKELIFHCLINLVKTFIYLKDLEKSDKYLNKIKAMDLLQKNQRTLIFYYNLKANWFYKKNNEKKALDFYYKSVSVLKAYKDYNLLKETYEAMMIIYKKDANYKKLSEVQEKYIDLMGTIKAENLEQAALSFEIQRQVNERRKKYKLIEEQNKILEQKNKRIIEQSKALEAVYDQLWEKYNTKESESRRDFLTGVFNRQGIEEALEAVAFSHKEENISVSCLIFDIDHFKTVNDTYGHLAGDQVIKKTCELCEKIMDESYVLGRYGGDEFVIIMEKTTLDEAEKMAQYIIDEVSNNKIRIEDQDDEIMITLSIGIMNTDYHDAKNVKDMVYIADLGLYNAKRKGRNQYDVYAG